MNLLRYPHFPPGRPEQRAQPPGPPTASSGHERQRDLEAVVNNSCRFTNYDVVEQYANESHLPPILFPSRINPVYQGQFCLLLQNISKKHYV